MIINKSFFGTKTIPHIEIDEDTIKELANKSIEKKQTVTGVQKKLSLNFDKDNMDRLTLVDYPVGYILKPQADEYPALPESEDLVMDIANAAGIKTVPHGLIEYDGKWAYITKRIDRKKDIKYAMEDFCQLSGRLTEDKYKGSYEKCVEVISQYSSRKVIDKTEFFLVILISFITGNSDMHLKNFSLIETKPGNREYVLSPAYDLLPVNVVDTNDKEELALPLNGKKTKIRRKDFLALAEKCEIEIEVAEKIINNISKRLPKFIEMTEQSEMPDELKERFIELMKERTERISE